MKKLVIILLPLLLVGGVVGAAMMGVINIPGLSPTKSDWKSSLVKTFKAHGSIKGDSVVLKDISSADKDAFVAAAKAGGLEPVVSDSGVKSAKLVELLKKEALSSTAAKAVATKAPPLAPTVVHAPKKPKSILKPEQGAETVAELWNGIGVAKLLPIIEKYKDTELATILLKMDSDHVAELLMALTPERAAALSREIQKQSSAG